MTVAEIFAYALVRVLRIVLSAALVLALFAVVLGLLGCGPPASMQLQDRQAVPVEAGPAASRFEVSLVGTFEDDLAYGNYRGVYLILDTSTGREYVGLSGVGIAETGAHPCGKGCIAEDER
jgi:hypothetical protein